MSTVLYIKANPKPDNASYTFRMSEAFIKAYQEQNPGDKIITLDLYKEDLRPLNAEMLGQMFAGQDCVMRKYAEQFAAADKYVIAAPMWNLSFPAILKMYFDYVMLAGVTFKYTEQGPVGLLTPGKKAAHITARGGLYSQGPTAQLEMGDRYIRTILGFMGVEPGNIITITTELTGVLQGQELEQSVNKSVAEAIQKASEF
ncbi:FMN-dependent NADH-azoreductase [Desulforamulus ferrireducens]|uniref:FMN dependent NADH:quinone oxidoreductase n=1 Tax=Desulforamulus ferrireducens TaxID=1833852 RepID=A0A1S6IZ07_9FIRM|nr:FMN-dependent NADH-azoreductase [Desulforamulus ferrireducens]AQS60005.1 FMN-dependent NADH-azoreductase [Desulforamulus ferrireducens]